MLSSMQETGRRWFLLIADEVREEHRIDLSSTTLRPLGPSVTRTASAKMSMPCNILSRASTENLTSLAAIWVSPQILKFRLHGANGFDAQDGEYADLVKKGIIDPTKVVRIALQDGASIAGLLITTEAMVAEKPKKETPMPAMPPGGGMDY